MGRKRDLTGQRFGRLIALYQYGASGPGRIWWWCRCDCGSELAVRAGGLTCGNSKSCGCRKREALADGVQRLADQRRGRPREDLTGERFGRWTVLAFAGVIGGATRWICRCDCGTQRNEVRQNGLVKGTSASCGCLNRERSSKKHRTHGQSKAVEFSNWWSAIDRCTNEKNGSYPNYGGKGITVCERWRLFENFKSDMPPRPSKLYTIDRIDSSGHYSCGKCDECKLNGWPHNVRWATMTAQQRNKRTNLLLTYNGETRCVAEWAEITGIHRDTIRKRVRLSGWSHEAALTTPAGQKPT